MAIYVVQWLWIWACVLLWLAQPIVGAKRNEISTYIDLVQEQGKWKVDGGLLSKGDWTRGETPTAQNSSSRAFILTVSKGSYLVYQNDVGPNFTASLEKSRMEDLMKSLVRDKENYNEFLPFSNAFNFAEVVMSIGAPTGPQLHTNVGVGSGVSSIEYIGKRYQTGAIKPIQHRPEMELSKIHLRTSLGYDQNKAFAFLLEAVHTKPTHIKNGSASDAAQDFEIKTDMVIRVVPLNQGNCRSQDFTYSLSCTGSDAKNHTCTYNNNWKPEPKRTPVICTFDHVDRNQKMPTTTTATTTRPKPTIGASGSVDLTPKLSIIAVLVIFLIAAGVGPLQEERRDEKSTPCKKRP